MSIAFDDDNEHAWLLNTFPLLPKHKKVFETRPWFTMNHLKNHRSILFFDDIPMYIEHKFTTNQSLMCLLMNTEDVELIGPHARLLMRLRRELQRHCKEQQRKRPHS